MNFFSKHKNKLILGLIILTILFIGLKSVQAKKAKDPSNYNQSKDIVITPEIKSIKSELTLAGSIDASEIAPLRFQNSGKLVWVGVKVGDKVRRGQAIASLDKEELKKSLQSQYNNYRTQLSKFWDTQDQYKDMVISDTMRRILDRTQYSLDNTVISYEIADMAIKEATLYSPIAGIVTDIQQPLAGTNITPATATFTIINPDSIFFRSEIDQEEVTQVKVGQKAILSIDSFPGKNYDSEITYVSFAPIAGQSSTTYEIRFKLPVKNQDLSYRLGMDGDATITLAQSDQTLVIPLDAINSEKDQYFVWIKKDGQLEKSYVKTGIENETEVQILEGLDSHEQVVIKKS